MKRILCKNQIKSMPTSLKAKRISKYIYNHIDGAYRYVTHSDSFDIYTTVYYQIPYWDRIPGKGSEYNDIHEMNIDINVTTYRDKIRVNLISTNSGEETVGYFTLSLREEMSMDDIYNKIYTNVCNKLRKYFDGYDFLF